MTSRETKFRDEAPERGGQGSEGYDRDFDGGRVNYIGFLTFRKKNRIRGLALCMQRRSREIHGELVS